MGNRIGPSEGARPVEAIRRGDFVAFTFDGRLLRGTVETVDAFGGGVCCGVEPSCDVMTDEPRLYKHVLLRDVRKSSARGEADD